MKKLISFFGALFLVLCIVSNASAFMKDWYFDADGVGSEAPTQISEFLDIVGPNYVLTDLDVETASVGTSFNFLNWGFFESSRHDGGAKYSWDGILETTGIYFALGTGVLGGAINFSAGDLFIYADNALNFSSDTASPTYYGSNDGTEIAHFSLKSGSGLINSSGLPNGDIDMVYEANSIASNVWFDKNMNDLADFPIEWIFGYSTTNASPIENPSLILTAEMQAYLASYGYEFPDGLPNTTPFAFYLSSNGQYRANVVPEPGTMLLLGAGLLGLGFYGRRKN